MRFFLKPVRLFQSILIKKQKKTCISAPSYCAYGTYTALLINLSCYCIRVTVIRKLQNWRSSTVLFRQLAITRTTNWKELGLVFTFTALARKGKKKTWIYIFSSPSVSFLYFGTNSTDACSHSNFAVHI